MSQVTHAVTMRAPMREHIPSLSTCWTTFWKIVKQVTWQSLLNMQHVFELWILLIFITEIIKTYIIFHHFNFLFLHKLSLETNNLHFRKAFRSLCSCLVKKKNRYDRIYIALNTSKQNHYDNRVAMLLAARYCTRVRWTDYLTPRCTHKRRLFLMSSVLSVCKD